MDLLSLMKSISLNQMLLRQKQIGDLPVIVVSIVVAMWQSCFSNFCGGQRFSRSQN